VTIPVPTPLVLVGAGGLGREAAACARATNAVVRRTWDLWGFVDDALAGCDREIDGFAVLGPVEHLEQLLARGDRTPEVVVCTGRPGATESRRTLARRLGAVDARFATIVHPTVSLAAGSSVGPGSIVLAQVVVTAPVVIGRHVVVMPHVVFTHDDRIGDFTTFGAGALLAGGVHVGDGAYIGSGACIREHVTIGAGAVIGMGSVVLRDVPAGEVWAGNPARRLDLDPAAAHPVASSAFGAGRQAIVPRIGVRIP
jgi:sugar O-acyltransferase (sialic acid O-acetyltransferase NeuD family)